MHSSQIRFQNFWRAFFHLSREPRKSTLWKDNKIYVLFLKVFQKPLNCRKVLFNARRVSNLRNTDLYHNQSLKEFFVYTLTKFIPNRKSRIAITAECNQSTSSRPLLN